MQKKKSVPQKNPVRTEKAKPGSSEIPVKRPVDLIIVFLYSVTELVPRLDAVDIMGSQWLYLSILNLLVTAYLIKGKRLLPNRFFKSGLMISYVGFILIAGLSFLVAYNVIESTVTYARLLISFIAFLNISSIIYHDHKILKPLFLILGLLVFYQSIEVLTAFFGNFRHAKNIDALIISIKGNAGNKNILAASMVIKIPFLIYAIHQLKRAGRIFFSIALLSSLLALFIVNARSSYIGLSAELLIYFLLIGYSWFKNGKKTWLPGLPGIVAGSLILSVAIIQLLFSSLEKQNKVVTYGGLAKRMESISLSNEGSSERILLWKNAIEFIQKEPFLGGGYGNWKIHSCAYERFWQPGWGASMNHVHNDFLEMCTDTGVPGGIMYAAIFLLLFWYAFGIIKSSTVSDKNKMIVVAAGMALAAYWVDSVFNFPLERPNVQVLFVISAAVLGVAFLDLKPVKTQDEVFSVHTTLSWCGIVLSAVALYVTFQVFQSMKIQSKIAVEWIGLPRESKVPIKSEDVNPYLPDIPNLNGAAMPIACIKAKYLCQEKRYDEALAILNADHGSNPYIYFSEFLRSMIALSTNQRDSAYYYAKVAFYSRPASLQLYDYLTSLATEVNDTIEMQKAFKEINQHYPRAENWRKYSENIFRATASDEKRMEVILDGLKIYPGNQSLLFQKYFLEGLQHYKRQEYSLCIDKMKSALEEKPDDPLCLQNIGYAYMNLKQYREAIPFLSSFIDQAAVKDGKMNYYRGVCYENLGARDSSCADFKSAKAMGYQINPKLLEGCR